MLYLKRYIAIFLLNIADTVSTYFLVNYDITLEANQIMAWVIANWGYIGVSLTKFIPLVILGFLLYKLKDTSRLINWAFNIAVVVYTVVVSTSVIIALL